MRCFQCGYGVKDSKLDSCPMCNTPLINHCKNCDSTNPEAAAYCISCGSKLNVQKVQESVRSVGVIFADISGFTALSEKLPPDEVKDLINDCFERITKPVMELGGSIDKYIGDCVMVSFGTNSPKEYDARQTANCAFEMRKAMLQYKDEFLSNTGIEIGLSIGASYGPAVIGNVGTELRQDYTVIGDTVNIASRLQELAKNGEILVSDTLYGETFDVFEYVKRDRLQLRNREASIQTYALSHNITAIKDQYIIYRKEISLIKDFINKSDFLTMNIYGETGIGKTTFIHNVQSSVNIPTYLVSSLPNQTRNAFGGISKLILEILSLQEEDNEDLKQMRLSSFSRYIFDEHLEETIIRNFNFISLLLGLPRDNDFDDLFVSMSYQDMVDELTEQVTNFVHFTLEKQKSIFVFDDIEYIDEKSLEIIKSFSNLNGKVIFTSENNKEYFEDQLSLELQPFDAKAIAKYMKDVSGLQLSLSSINTIIEITNGNTSQIYAVASQLDSTTTQKDEHGNYSIIPSFLNSIKNRKDKLILSRLSKLTKQEYLFIEYASAMYDEIDSRVMEVILETNQNDAIIETFLDMKVIYVSSYLKLSNKFSKKYRFTNYETKVSILKTIPNKRLISLYSSLLDITKKLHINNISPVLPELVHYCNLSNQYVLMKEYLYEYGKFLEKEYEYEAAIAEYERYIEIAHEKDSSIDKRVIEVKSRLSNLYISVAKYEEAVSLIQNTLDENLSENERQELQLLLVDTYKATANIPGALELLENLKEELSTTSHLYGKMLQHLCTIYNMVGKPGVIEIASESQELLIKANDFVSVAETMSQAGIRSFIEGKIKEGINLLEKAIDFAKLSRNKTTESKIMINLGILYSNFGEKSKSNEFFMKAMDLSKEVSNARSYVSAAINLGVSLLHDGKYNKAQQLFEEAIRLSSKARLLYQQCICLTNLGDIFHEIGEYDKSNHAFEQSLDLAKMMSLPIEESINNLGLAKNSILQKRTENVLEILDKCEEVFKEKNERQYLIDVAYYKSSFYQLQGELNLALDSCKEGITIAEEVGNPNKIIMIKRKQYEIQFAQSKNEEIIADLNSLEEKATNIRNFYELAQIELLLADIALHTNDKTSYNKHLQNAYEASNKFDQCTLTKQIDKKISQIAKGSLHK